MTNRLMALVAYLMLCAFLAILVFSVGRIDLGVVVLVTLLLAGYDLLTGAFRTRKK